MCAPPSVTASRCARRIRPSPRSSPPIGVARTVRRVWSPGGACRSTPSATPRSWRRRRCSRAARREPPPRCATSTSAPQPSAGWQPRWTNLRWATAQPTVRARRARRGARRARTGRRVGGGRRRCAGARAAGTGVTADVVERTVDVAEPAGRDGVGERAGEGGSGGVLANVLAVPLAPFVALWEAGRVLCTRAIPALVAAIARAVTGAWPRAWQVMTAPLRAAWQRAGRRRASRRPTCRGRAAQVVAVARAVGVRRRGDRSARARHGPGRRAPRARHRQRRGPARRRHRPRRGPGGGAARRGAPARRGRSDRHERRSYRGARRGRRSAGGRRGRRGRQPRGGRRRAGRGIGDAHRHGSRPRGGTRGGRGRADRPRRRARRGSPGGRGGSGDRCPRPGGASSRRRGSPRRRLRRHAASADPCVGPRSGPARCCATPVRRCASGSDVEAELHHVAVLGDRSPCPRGGSCRAPWPSSTSRCRAARPTGSPRRG